MKKNLFPITLACILLLMACSCGATATRASATASTIPVAHISPTPTPAPTMLLVTRIAPPAALLAPLDKTITDTSEVQALYRTALATPVIPKGAIISCPVALARYQGVYYRLLFFHNKLLVNQMTLSASGCYTLNINSDPHGHLANSTFLSLFLQMIGRSSLLS